MNFELGKEYIVKVSEKGIVPIEEFDRNRWYDKDFDDLDFLTDEEKIVVINNVLDKIRTEILKPYGGFELGDGFRNGYDTAMVKVLNIIDKYKAVEKLSSVEPEKCGDCVSRRSIIGKCEDTAKATSESGEINTGFIMALDFIADYAKHMPSVEPKKSEDLISRHAAINAFEKFIHELDINDEPYNYGEMALSCQNVPSATPHTILTETSQRWIPVSERLPEKEMNCLVTDSLGKVHQVTFHQALDGRESYFSGCYCVRAWMPLPEPYKAESEG